MLAKPENRCDLRAGFDLHERDSLRCIIPMRRGLRSDIFVTYLSFNDVAE
jgi:hypothetical protein